MSYLYTCMCVYVCMYVRTYCRVYQVIAFYVFPTADNNDTESLSQS